jgi:hypothetical protein
VRAGRIECVWLGIRDLDGFGQRDTVLKEIPLDHEQLSLKDEEIKEL